MGNKLTRKRQMVDEKYTRPQGLYQHRDVDYKKLRKLILDSKLAPCYPGNEECTFDLEECPICFLYYPSLNRSRCCMKGICTECFLRMKPPHSTRPTQCPFCKTSNYAVEYHGIMSKEEKGMEQVEEQRVIEAKIRMRQQELLDEEERMQWKGINSSCRISSQGGIECHDVASSSLAVPSFGIPVEGDGTTSSQESFVAPTVGQSSNLTHNRDDEFDFDLEEIMLMEAIWLSIQETGSQRNPPHGAAAPPESFVREDNHLSSVSVDAPSPSGGLACAIAAIVEHQVNGDTSSSSNRNMPEFNIIPDPSGFSNEEELVARNYTQNSWIEVSPNSGRAVSMQERGWGIDQESETVEAGACYTSSDGTGEAGLAAFPLPDGIGDRFQSNISGPIIPESFEEQMMLAMAVSLAEARARTNAQEVAWL